MEDRVRLDFAGCCVAVTGGGGLLARECAAARAVYRTAWQPRERGVRGR